jgi:exosome complex RNA-binding protein Rrp42 (RNase PH superfamily)
MGASEEMELDLKLGEKIAENKTLRDKNIALRTKMGKVQQILNKIILDPKANEHAKMQVAAALAILRESP